MSNEIPSSSPSQIQKVRNVVTKQSLAMRIFTTSFIGKGKHGNETLNVFFLLKVNSVCLKKDDFSL